MNYCDLCGGESTLKEKVHPYCLRYFLKDDTTTSPTHTQYKLKIEADIYG